MFQTNIFRNWTKYFFFFNIRFYIKLYRYKIAILNNTFEKQGNEHFI